MSMTYEEILQGMLNLVPSNVDKREGSVIYDALAPCAYFLAQQYFQLENFIDLVLPDTALAEYLDRTVSAYGMKRKAATAAVRQMETSAAVDIGTRWAISGIVYEVTAEVGDCVYEATCEMVGEIGNQYSGALSPVSNVVGVTAELTEILVQGTDEETDEALRERFYLKVQLPATSGNAHHYQQWALEVPGVGRAKVFPLDNGPGTVTVLIVDSDMTVDETLENTVANYIDAERPIGATVTVDSPEEVVINVTANVLLDGTATIGEIQSEIETSLDAFLRDMVFVNYRLSYAKVGNLILDATGVDDYENLVVNGGMTNINLSEKQIPVVGTVTLSEVSALALD